MSKTREPRAQNPDEWGKFGVRRPGVMSRRPLMIKSKAAKTEVAEKGLHIIVIIMFY